MVAAFFLLFSPHTPCLLPDALDVVMCISSARTRLGADAKSSAKGGQRQFSGLIDVYKQTLKTDGVAGLYRGFVPSVVGIIVYRGL